METRTQEGLPPTLVVSNWIAGAATAQEPVFARRNPAQRDDVVAIAPLTDSATVQRACEVAQEAQRGWSRVPPPQRAQALRELARLLRVVKEDLARFVAREVGKPLTESRSSVQEAIDATEFFLGEGRRLYGQTLPSELPEKELSTWRRPVGVVGMITMGCFPVAAPVRRLAPALLSGNAVVWKPSEDAPGTAALLTELIRQAGVPAGVFNVVHGAGAGGAGEFLVAQVEAGLVDQIAFTGSTEVGRQIAVSCARALRPASLALGGKNALVILTDADVELAVDGAVSGAFGTAGQRCTSVGNIVVDKRILPLVRDQLLTRARSLVIGDPLRENVSYGPFINERFLQQWIQQRAVGLEESAELLLDGRRVVPGDEPPGFVGDAARGLYATPRIFDRVKPTMRVAREECLGPTVNLIEVNGLDEAINAANATCYGLCAAVYTRDARAMLRFREQVRVGMITVNSPTTEPEVHLPFSGRGWSGNGSCENGIWGLDTYTRWQAVNADLSGTVRRKPSSFGVEPSPELPEWDKLTRA